MKLTKLHLVPSNCVVLYLHSAMLLHVMKVTALPQTLYYATDLLILRERILKEVFKNIAEGIRSIGKPRKKWLDDVENNLQKTGVRDSCKLILKEAKVLHGRTAIGEEE